MTFKKYVLVPVLALVIAGGAFLGGHAFVSNAWDSAYAEGAASVDAGPAPAAEPRPSDSIDDPTKAPGEYFDDLKAAKKTGWALAVLVGLRGLLFLLGAWAPVSWLRQGKSAVVIAGAGAVVTALFDSLMLGGTWVAAVIAAAGALFWYLDGAFKPKEQA